MTQKQMFQMPLEDMLRGWRTSREQIASYKVQRAELNELIREEGKTCAQFERMIDEHEGGEDG